jgi:hypothetical protein
LDTLRAAALIAAALISLMFCLGFGWAPPGVSLDWLRVALLGLAATGLLWPVVLLALVRRRAD